MLAAADGYTLIGRGDQDIRVSAFDVEPSCLLELVQYRDSSDETEELAARLEVIKL